MTTTLQSIALTSEERFNLLNRGLMAILPQPKDLPDPKRKKYDREYYTTRRNRLFAAGLTAHGTPRRRKAR